MLIVAFDTVAPPGGSRSGARSPADSGAVEQVMVSRRVQSTVDGFDFNPKLTDSVECSPKLPQARSSAAFPASAGIVRDGAGAGGGTNSRAAWCARLTHLGILCSCQKGALTFRDTAEGPGECDAIGTVP